MSTSLRSRLRAAWAVLRGAPPLDVVLPLLPVAEGAGGALLVLYQQRPVLLQATTDDPEPTPSSTLRQYQLVVLDEQAPPDWSPEDVGRSLCQLGEGYTQARILFVDGPPVDAPDTAWITPRRRDRPARPAPGGGRR